MASIWFSLSTLVTVLPWERLCLLALLLVLLASLIIITRDYIATPLSRSVHLATVTESLLQPTLISLLLTCLFFATIFTCLLLAAQLFLSLLLPVLSADHALRDAAWTQPGELTFFGVALLLLITLLLLVLGFLAICLYLKKQQGLSYRLINTEDANGNSDTGHNLEFGTFLERHGALVTSMKANYSTLIQKDDGNVNMTVV